MHSMNTTITADRHLPMSAAFSHSSSPSPLVQLFNSVQKKTLRSRTSVGFQKLLKVTKFLVTLTYSWISVKVNKEVKLVHLITSIERLARPA